MIEKNTKDLNFLAGELAEGGVMDLQLFPMTGMAEHRKAIEEVKEANTSIPQKLEMISDSDLFEGL
jgi:hypothetical protein